MRCRSAIQLEPSRGRLEQQSILGRRADQGFGFWLSGPWRRSVSTILRSFVSTHCTSRRPLLTTASWATIATAHETANAGISKSDQSSKASKAPNEKIDADATLYMTSPYSRPDHATILAVSQHAGSPRKTHHMGKYRYGSRARFRVGMSSLRLMPGSLNKVSELEPVDFRYERHASRDRERRALAENAGARSYRSEIEVDDAAEDRNPHGHLAEPRNRRWPHVGRTRHGHTCALDARTAPDNRVRASWRVCKGFAASGGRI